MKRSASIIAICLVLLLLLFVTTDPNTVPPFLLIIPFILLFVAIFLSISALLGAYGVGDVKRVRVAVLTTSAPVLLLVLQSIGQLTVRDVLTTGAVFLLSYFYIARTATRI